MIMFDAGGPRCVDRAARMVAPELAGRPVGTMWLFLRGKAQLAGEEVAMPLPRWLARINKRVFNPREIRRGVRPVLTHVGRSSGRTYRTPLDAHALPDGYLFFPLYGPRTDWVRNVLAAGGARLSIDGEEMQLESPRMVRKQDIWPHLPAGTKTPVGVSDESELLRMDVRQGG